MWETEVRSLGWEDPLKKRMATHSSILTWRIPWTEEPGAQQATIHGFQRVKHDWVTNTKAHTVIIFKNAGSQVLNSLEVSIELLMWFLILYFCYEMFFCSVTKLSLTLCDPMNCSTPSFHILHYLPEPAQTHVHWISDAIQPSHSLSPSTPALNLSQHQDLFKWVGFSHQVAKVLEFQLQHQSFQWIFRTDFL